MTKPSLFISALNSLQDGGHLIAPPYPVLIANRATLLFPMYNSFRSICFIIYFLTTHTALPIVRNRLSNLIRYLIFNGRDSFRDFLPVYTPSIAYFQTIAIADAISLLRPNFHPIPEVGVLIQKICKMLFGGKNNVQSHLFIKQLNFMINQENLAGVTLRKL